MLSSGSAPAELSRLICDQESPSRIRMPPGAGIVPRPRRLSPTQTRPSVAGAMLVTSPSSGQAACRQLSGVQAAIGQKLTTAWTPDPLGQWKRSGPPSASQPPSHTRPSSGAPPAGRSIVSAVNVPRVP